MSNALAPPLRSSDPFELAATTEPGAGLVRIAEALAGLPDPTIEELRHAGYLAAPVPAENGGLGVTAIHDVIVASSRLARGHASMAIGVGMHLAVLLNLVRRRQSARAAADHRQATALAASINAIARDGVLMGGGNDDIRPRASATRTPSGWRVDGREAFYTTSETALHTAVAYVDDEGIECYGYVEVPTGAAGVAFCRDDAVTLTDVLIPHAALRGGFRAGGAEADLERHLLCGLFHAAASLGIAESAASAAAAARADARTQMLLAEIRIDLGACRATLSRSAALVQSAEPDLAALAAETQAARTFVDETAARIVDRAVAVQARENRAAAAARADLPDKRNFA